MKKIISILSCALALTAVTSCDWFKLDNLEDWDAKVEGRILDKATNQPVQLEQGSSITIYESYGAQYDREWDGHTANTWLVKNNGTYVNNLVFSGKYEMDTKNNNFTADAVNFELKSGSNTVDFYVTPYLRINNPKVSFSGNSINATFDVEIAVPGTKINRVEVCVFPDRWVRHSNNNCSADPGSYVVNPTGTSFSLSVDTALAANATEFQYQRAHFIRIAALGQNPLNSSNMYNYSQVYKLENGTITEVTDW